VKSFFRLVLTLSVFAQIAFVDLRDYVSYISNTHLETSRFYNILFSWSLIVSCLVNICTCTAEEGENYVDRWVHCVWGNLFVSTLGHWGL